MRVLSSQNNGFQVMVAPAMGKVVGSMCTWEVARSVEEEAHAANDW